MLESIRTSAQAMKALSDKQEVISNNLANANTNGFKTDGVTMNSFADTLQSAIGGTQVKAVSYTDQTPSTLRPTGNPLDVAIDGKGYFAIQTADGEQYTRNGSFTINNVGQLTTSNGDLVLSDAGAINVDSANGGSVTIDKDGRISVGDAPKGKLKTVTIPPDAQVQKVGNGLIALTDGSATPANVRVSQGYLETSSVNTVSQMVDMIDTLRNFEANQKAITTEDTELGRAISQLGS